MKQINRIQNSIQFIENHLKENITIKDAADTAFFSLYHYSRTFNQITRHSPYEYIIKRRLSEAAIEITNSNKKIIEIAYDYQFQSPEAFTRAFKRLFHITPSQLKRSSHMRLQLFPPLNMDINLKIINSQIKEFYLPGKKYTGMMTEITRPEDKKIQKLWTTLLSIAEIESNILTGIIFHLNRNLKKSFYMALWEKSSTEKTKVFPFSVITLDLPDKKYHKINQISAKDQWLARDYLFQYHSYKNNISYELDFYIEQFALTEQERKVTDILFPYA